MTDAPRDSAPNEPRECALPGCSVLVEQPHDGGPPRLYCSPAHRATARKLRHNARMEATEAPGGEAKTQPVPTQSVPPALAGPQSSDDDTVEVPAAATADDGWSPAASWPIAPPALPPEERDGVKKPKKPRVRKLKPVRQLRRDDTSTGERKNPLRRRMVASIAIASLVAGGSGYVVTEAITPTPQQAPPPNDPQTAAMEADIWATQAEVVLASLNEQLNALAQTEATWLRLPEDLRNQVPPAVRALLDRKALLEQQRATLMSQLAALRALPGLTTDLATAQAELDAVERALQAAPAAPGTPDQAQAVQLLNEQRDMRREQRDANAQELSNLQNGVQQALTSPLPEDEDRTSPIVEQVLALIEQGVNGDPGDDGAGASDGTESDGIGDDPAQLAAGPDDEQAVTQRRENPDHERDDTSVTAPPDPDRSPVAAVFADPGSDRDRGHDAGPSGDDDGGPVEHVATAAVHTVDNLLSGGSSDDDDDRGRGDDDDNRWGGSRDDDRDDRWGGGRHDDDDDDDDGGSIIGDVTDGLLGGSDRDDDDDDRGRHDRDDDDRDHDGGWWGDSSNDDDDDRDRGRHDRDDHEDDDDSLLPIGDDRDDHDDWGDRDDHDDWGDRDDHDDWSDRDDHDDWGDRDQHDEQAGNDDVDRQDDNRPSGKRERQQRQENNLQDSTERLGQGSGSDDGAGGGDGGDGGGGNDGGSSDGGGSDGGGSDGGESGGDSGGGGSDGGSGGGDD